MNQSEAIISVTGLKKSYKDIEVLKGIDFTLKRGSIFTLLGSNGAGKTTTVKILSTLVKPDGGKAEICGNDVVRQVDKVREYISLTGQYAAVDEVLTGRENLHMICSLRHLSDGEQKTKELLEAFDLTDAAHRRVSTYSGGMRRRLDLAMSLVGNPAVIFLDEPTTGLDPRGRLAMWEIVKSLAAAGTTVFLTTQYLEEAEQLADHIAILNDGKIIAEGTADSLKKEIPNGIVELAFYRKTDMEQAHSLMEGYQISKNEAMLTVNIITDGSVNQLSDILNRLNQSGIQASGFIQKLPTLEDVFLSLIGEKQGVNNQ